MNKQDITKVVREAVSHELNANSKTCSLGIDRDQHTVEHEFIKSLMKLFDRIDHMKIGILGKVITAVAYGLFLCMVLGAGVYLSKLKP